MACSVERSSRFPNPRIDSPGARTPPVPRIDGSTYLPPVATVNADGSEPVLVSLSGPVSSKINTLRPPQRSN